MQHLVKQDSKAPDIKCMVMLTILNHLRRHVLECPAESLSRLACHRTPAEIADLESQIFPNQHILRLYVSVNQPI